MIFVHLESGNGFYVNSIISIILYVLMIVCTILLLVTAFKNKKPKRLLPWLIIQFIWLILELVDIYTTDVLSRDF